jgi:hypothetical protein
MPFKFLKLILVLMLILSSNLARANSCQALFKEKELQLQPSTEDKVYLDQSIFLFNVFAFRFHSIGQSLIAAPKSQNSINAIIKYKRF